MEDKKRITLTIIGVATLLILVISATFAYFSATTSNDKGETNVTASTETVGSIALSNPTGDLHLNLSVSDMAQDNLNTYWATDDENKNYDSEEVQREIAVAELSGGSATAKYECSTTISVELSDTMSSQLQAGDGYIQFGGLLTDKIDLTNVSSDGYLVTFNLDGTNTKRQAVSAAIALENRNADQSYIAGTNLGIKFSNSDLECKVVSKTNLSETIMALSEVDGSDVYKENISGSYMMPYNVIPANESSWTSIDNTGNGVFKVIDEANGTWGGNLAAECKLDEEEIDVWCNNVEPETITLIPLYDGNYEFKSRAFNENFTVTIYIDNEKVFEGDGFEDPSTILKNLTPENTIKVTYNSSAGLASDLVEPYKFQFQFYLSTEEEANIETYRYEGANVNNYVTFNDETWRIIGVEEGSTIGLESDKYYTKIIRSEAFSTVIFDNYSYDVPWKYAPLEKLLNEGYYNRKEFEGENDNFDFTTTGLTEESRGMITQPTWISLNYDNVSTTFGTYFYEKTISHSSFGSHPDSYSSSGYVGLMSASDYGYAALQSECKETALTSYSACATNNWLFTGNDEWLISNEEIIEAEDGLYWALGVNSEGNVVHFAVEEDLNYRPVVYLDSDVVITKGNGEENNKYEISLNK